MQASYLRSGTTRFRDRFLSLDFQLIFLVMILGIISFFAMYSTERGNFNYYTESHIFRFCAFFLIFIAFSFFKIQFWYRYSYLFYFLILLLLIAVDFFGITASGSKRWINLFVFNLQPSELMKVALIIFLAKYYNTIPVKDISRIRFMIIPIFVLFIPVALVISQPDLGTALLIGIGGLIVVWLAGIKIKFFMFSFVTLSCLMPVVIAFLKPYQKLRILTFFNPERDPLGAGYQIIQSKIAVGSGGIFGKGFLKGSQSYLDYLPEKHTDFIFTLFSEEFGFIGSIGLLILYSIIIFRIVRIGSISRSNFARLFCFGYAFAIFIYIFVNLSMVLGLLPIVGSPLPIMSYGGSSMLATMIGFGIVLSAKINHKQMIA